MERKTRKVGIMGGTFDPIHIGHLILGETAYEQLSLDEVWFLPAGNPPHKQNRKGRASDEQRVEMVRRAIASNPHFRLSLIEMNADGYTYTYRTLERLQKEHPDTSFFFIIGADSLFDFHEWKNPSRICAAANLVVATRNQVSANRLDQAIEENTKRFGGTFLKLDSPNLDISSRNIREMIAEKRSVKYYLTDPVIDFIAEHQIYKDKEQEDGTV
ncbi:MAG: nicotinate-nucleotide adenylyltransferase [Fusicatenibacter sp.]|nr:nicotinate-nucleotide adenylyltransferase [Lachnospiraceae bacterium]MDY2937505.1 nicotinate-nucleotide adenylyltransferase [Fusicatenibacter sp.]